MPEVRPPEQQVADVVYEPLVLYLEVAFVYLMMNTVLTILQSKLEGRLSKHVQTKSN